MEMEDQCVITSVSLDYLKRVKEAEPELKTGYILAAAYGSYYKNEFVDFISIRSSLVTKKQIQAAHEYGKAIHVWTVNSRSEIEQMALIGVDNIITDYPARAKEVLYQPDVAKNLLAYNPDGDEIGGKYIESSIAESGQSKCHSKKERFWEKLEKDL